MFSQCGSAEAWQSLYNWSSWVVNVISAISECCVGVALKWQHTSMWNTKKRLHFVTPVLCTQREICIRLQLIIILISLHVSIIFSVIIHFYHQNFEALPDSHWPLTLTLTPQRIKDYQKCWWLTNAGYNYKSLLNHNIHIQIYTVSRHVLIFCHLLYVNRSGQILNSYQYCEVQCNWNIIILCKFYKGRI